MDITNKKLQRIETAPINRREAVGLKLTLAVPALTAGETLQYTLDSAELSALRNFPSANQMVIINTNTTDILKIRLGISEQSAYYIPPNSIISLTNLDYNSFDIKNTHATTATTATEVIIHIIYEHAPKVAVVSGGR